MMLIQRRAFLQGITSVLAAPAIVRFESLMPVRATIVSMRGLTRYQMLDDGQFDVQYGLIARDIARKILQNQPQEIPKQRRTSEIDQPIDDDWKPF